MSSVCRNLHFLSVQFNSRIWETISHAAVMYAFEDNSDVLPVLLNCMKFDKDLFFEDQFSAQSGLTMGLLDVCND